MTTSTRSGEGLDARRRKLLFRSWHRGIREMDLILGGFADQEIHVLNEADLDRYERLLENQDADLLSWVTGETLAPETHSDLLKKIMAARRAATA